MKEALVALAETDYNNLGSVLECLNQGVAQTNFIDHRIPPQYPRHTTRFHHQHVSQVENNSSGISQDDMESIENQVENVGNLEIGSTELSMGSGSTMDTGSEVNVPAPDEAQSGISEAVEPVEDGTDDDVISIYSDESVEFLYSVLDVDN